MVVVKVILVLMIVIANGSDRHSGSEHIVSCSDGSDSSTCDR